MHNNRFIVIMADFLTSVSYPSIVCSWIGPLEVGILLTLWLDPSWILPSPSSTINKRPNLIKHTNWVGRQWPGEKGGGTGYAWDGGGYMVV